MAAKNPCGRTVALPYKDNAYEVWESPEGSWKWYVLKKYHANDEQENARWFALVESPFTPDGELGDVYVSDVTDNAIRIK